MKNFKRFISLLLVFVLSIAISVPAFAAETEPTIPDVEKHTIEIMLDPGESIDNERINKIGVLAGASKYHGAGIDLMKKVGDKVEQGETLYRLHSVNSTDFAFANSMVDGYTGYEISGRSKY